VVPQESFGAVRVIGVPLWLRSTAERSLEAVWQELRSRPGSPQEHLEILGLVAGRLFAGYGVKSASGEGDPVVVLIPAVAPPRWSLRLEGPALSGPPGEWLSSDVRRTEKALAPLLDEVPVEALGWGDGALRKVLQETGEQELPGWELAPLVQLSGGQAELRVRLLPSPPLVLALAPSLRSTSLPLMLKKDLTEALLKNLAPIHGLPVAWVRHHQEEAERWAGDILEDRNTVQNTRASVAVRMKPKEIAPVDVRVESRTYVLQAWMAAYAGSDALYPEVGIHLGRRASLWSRGEVELYGEWIAKVHDFGLESRWGVRTSPVGDLWLGVEVVWPGETVWGRLWLENDARRAYAWWRLSRDGDNQGSVGWHLTDHISLELHYDDRVPDQLILRAVGTL